MTSLQSTAKSEHIPKQLRLRIDPASRCPATFEQLTLSDREKVFRFNFAPEAKIPYNRRYFSERAERSCIWSYYPLDVKNGLEPDIEDLELWQRLAAGEAVEMDHPLLGADTPGTGTLNWVVGVGRRPFDSDPGRLFSFVPSGALPPGIALTDWQKLRFPFFFRPGREDLSDEAVRIFAYRRWVDETSPADAHPSHREVLHEAVIDNLEHLVLVVLQQVGRVDEGPVEAITETALGIAMENGGGFKGMQGLMQGVHRAYRDDDFTEAESSKTWDPRTQRIAALLKDAGAVDYTPIFDACLNGEVAEVRRLLADGFPPNFAVYGHYTALCAAVRGGNPEVCQLLLEAGADPNFSRPYRNSMLNGGTWYPLESAGEDPALVKLLLDAGADPSIRKDNSDGTPIAFRVAFTCREGARLIFSKVPFASLRDRHGRSGLFHLSMDEIGYCEEFIPPEIVDAADTAGFTPLMFAVVSGRYALVDWLLEAGASVDQISSWPGDYGPATFRYNQEGFPLVLTPLQAAMLNGEYRLLVQLFSHGAKPHQTLIRFYREARIPQEALEEIWRKVRHHEATLSATDEAATEEADAVDTSEPPYSLLREVEDVEAGMLRLVCRRPDLSGEFPLLLKTVDIGALAAEREVPTICRQAYDGGAPLSALELLRLAGEAVTAGRALVDRFVDSIQSGDNDPPDLPDLYAAIDHAGELVDFARIAVTEETPPQRNRASEIIAAASEEFDGGNARARRASQTGEDIGFDDFIDALKEKADPGSTMDLGKLGQAARRTLRELDQECVELMRKL